MELKILDCNFFRAASACYDPATVLGEDWTGTIVDILRMEEIPAKDRIWAATRPGVLDEKTLRLIVCRYVRETPIGDGRTVWDLLPERGPSRAAVEIAERFCIGLATRDELRTAADDAYAYAYAYAAAADDAYAAADDAAAAAYAAAYAADAADAAAYAAAAAAYAAAFAAAATARMSTLTQCAVLVRQYVSRPDLGGAA